ncbi:ferric reductase [Aliiroseovarius sp. KMU-50]|uniref:Ferric reductase n=1 Tax=Aliiroseovarius salicola TaxID=3009082 RepID=A0ABT4W5K8_9RHOB|nr:ferric reductase [Aliiroseovarius sp. KMU-50]MDA5095804.1 ferric reductase [Aliiroseovarius sp. KMU-50]
MDTKNVSPTQRILVWGVLATAIVVPLALSALSPLLAWRQPIYIAAGFAGVSAMVLMLLQPLLAGAHLPGLPPRWGRWVHRLVGGILVATIIVHVAGLWITSPPDVIDALLFRSPTPFSVWGVLAMWAIFGAAGLAAFRKSLGLSPRNWRRVHTALITVAVASSVFHAMLIEGTMEIISKFGLCVLVVGATAKTVADRRVWKN